MQPIDTSLRSGQTATRSARATTASAQAPSRTPQSTPVQGDHATVSAEARTPEQGGGEHAAAVQAAWAVPVREETPGPAPTANPSPSPSPSPGGSQPTRDEARPTPNPSPGPSPTPPPEDPPLAGQEPVPTDVPEAPPGASVDDNIDKTESENPGGVPVGILKFRDRVKNGGEWDYKQQGSQYEDFGNFNYGATCAATGLSLEQCLQEAGRAQQSAGTSRPEYGEPGPVPGVPVGGSGNYGDDPKDQARIKQGYEYYKNRNERVLAPGPSDGSGGSQSSSGGSVEA